MKKASKYTDGIIDAPAMGIHSMPLSCRFSIGISTFMTSCLLTQDDVALPKWCLLFKGKNLLLEEQILSFKS